MKIPVVWLRHFHAGATVLWMVLMGPSLLWWRESVPWLVAMSVWANVAGHFASWMGARSEEANTIPPTDPPRRRMLVPEVKQGRRGLGKGGPTRGLGRARTP